MMRRLYLLLFLALAVSACAVDSTTAPFGVSDLVRGTVSGSSMEDFFYSHHRGTTYIYSNKLNTYLYGADNDPISINGPSDTITTLGYQGQNGNGDSVFAICAKYEVLSSYSAQAQATLAYIPASGGFAGAFVTAPTTLTGEVFPTNISTPAVSNDMVVTGAGGRLRQLTDDFGSNATKVWQADTIYFTAHQNSVRILQKSGGSYSTLRNVFVSNASTGDHWLFNVADSITSDSVLADNTSVTVPAGTYASSVKLGVSTSALSLPMSEEKYFGLRVGPIKQVDSWWTTGDGIARLKHVLIRELTQVVIDKEEEI